MTTAAEKLGPAEKILQTLLNHTDHMVHNRPGLVTPDARHTIGVRWVPVTHKEENGQKVVYELTKVGKKTNKVRKGVMRADNKIEENGKIVGEYRAPGLFPEVAAWMYRQVAEVWRMDNEFAARWASYAFGEEHRDLKVVLAAFMLTQTRKGDPVVDGGKIAFYDEDYRTVGEAMVLIHRRDGKDLNPKLLLRVHDLLKLPGVAAINRELGFGNSARRPFLGRWTKAVEKWLQFREENPRMLDGLIKAGFKSTVKDLARAVGYKPETPKFFEALGWAQDQSKDGRRSILIGVEMAKGETWEDLTETQICEKIVADRPDWKRIVGLLPKKLGVTRAIMSASVESGALSNKDLIILTPTLEELGLLEVKEVKEKWDRALKKAEDDMRAMNIARNVKSKEVKEQLVAASDTAIQKAVEQVTKNLRIFVVIDVSGSMGQSIEKAKMLLAKFLQGFPPDRTHVAVFNTSGRVVEIKHPSAAGVENAFKGIMAGGGTAHSSGVMAFVEKKLAPKDDEDVLFIWVGDGGERATFEHHVRQSGLRPMAFGFLKLPGENFGCIESTAAALGIPCFPIVENTFDDVYAIPRTIRALVAATPVGVVARAVAVARVSLVDTILKQPLLTLPAWAASARVLRAEIDRELATPPASAPMPVPAPAPAPAATT
jgi:Mg-chelatase subunit ChlD